MNLTPFRVSFKKKKNELAIPGHNKVKGEKFQSQHAQARIDRKYQGVVRKTWFP